MKYSNDAKDKLAVLSFLLLEKKENVKINRAYLSAPHLIHLP